MKRLLKGILAVALCLGIFSTAIHCYRRNVVALEGRVEVLRTQLTQLELVMSKGLQNKEYVRFCLIDSEEQRQFIKDTFEKKEIYEWYVKQLEGRYKEDGNTGKIPLPRRQDS